ncbi:MAG: hypothetical protein K8J09_00160 [Planctomycetes bacterium]|nr:hypothetical protein [Planctomycetota bacterium]MCC7399441.1 hypothetical protein [Planctomycetota bacterium]
MTLLPQATLLATVALAAVAAILPAQCANVWQPIGCVPGLDGSVYAMTRWDADGPGPQSERVVYGGLFTSAGGVPAYGVAVWDPATGSWSTLGTGVGGGPVTALLAMPNGDLIAGGPFRTSLGAVGDHLARWNGTTWVPYGGLTPVSEGVTSLALLPNGDVAVGGWFVAAGATVLNRIGIYNGTTWSTLGSGMDGPVLGLCTLANGDLVAGGYFTSAGGVAADGIARWNGATWIAMGSVPAVRGLVALPNGDLVAVGQFVQADGAAANGVAQWNGSTWSALGTGLAGVGGPGVGAVTLLQNGDLVVGGNFTQAGGSAATGIARWDGAGWSPIGGGVVGTVNAFAELGNGELLIGGSFAVAGGVPASRVARWDGTAWSALAAGSAPDNTVHALRSTPDGLIAAGEFLTIGGLVANGVARWHGSTWSPFGSGPAVLRVQAMAVGADGALVVGGTGPVSRWDGSAWSNLGTALFSPVRALAVLPSGKVVAGFGFSTLASYGVASWDGMAWSDLGGGVYGDVYSLAVLSNGDLVVGGQIFAAGTVSTNGIARWDGNSWSPLGAGLQAGGGSDGGAWVIEPLPNGGLIAGGWFTSAGGVPANNIAIWNGTSWSPLGAGTNGPVLAMHRLPDGDLLVSGTFTQAGGVAADRVARWNGSTWSSVGASIALSSYSWPTPVVGGVRAIAATAEGDLLLGGSMSSILGQASSNLVRMSTTCPASVLDLGAGCAGDVVTAALPWTGSLWSADAVGLPNDALVLTVHGLAPIALPLPLIFGTALPGCTLHVAPDFVGLTTATFGTASSQLLLPDTSALAGIVFHHQMVALDLAAPFVVTATNALTMTVGSF